MSAKEQLAAERELALMKSLHHPCVVQVTSRLLAGSDSLEQVGGKQHAQNMQQGSTGIPEAQS